MAFAGDDDGPTRGLTHDASHPCVFEALSVDHAVDVRVGVPAMCRDHLISKLSEERVIKGFIEPQVTLLLGRKAAQALLHHRGHARTVREAGDHTQLLVDDHLEDALIVLVKRPARLGPGSADIFSRLDP